MQEVTMVGRRIGKPKAFVELTSLDFLNLGVPSPTPSLSELLRQAKSNVEA
jgi:microcin C transport system permease protein